MKYVTDRTGYGFNNKRAARRGARFTTSGPAGGLGSFAGAVVDWYDFLLYGITAALVFNREFFRKSARRWERLPPLPPSALGFFSPARRNYFGHFGDRLGRKRMLMMTVWMMGIATACIGLLPRSTRSAGGRRCCWCSCVRFRDSPSAANGAARRCSRWRMPHREKSLYSSGVQVGYGVGLLLSTGLVSLISSLTSNQQFLSWGWRVPFLFSVVLVLIALWIRNGMAESQEFEAQQSRTTRRR
nr:Inner membrane metabolite transport protein yhjE [Klebsiella pneumoniae]